MRAVILQLRSLLEEASKASDKEDWLHRNKGLLRQMVNQLQECCRTQRLRDAATSSKGLTAGLNKNSAKWLMMAKRLMEEELERPGTYPDLHKKII